jgi:nucleotide-binding universal stress UspA family protein
MHRTVVVAASHWQPLRDAFALGVNLARPRGAGIVLARVDIGPPHPAPELEALRVTAPPDIPIETLVVTGPSIPTGLRDVIAAHDAELLVLGSSHLRTATRALRGDVALETVRDAPCAVAVAPLGYAATEPHAPHAIGVAWDGGDESAEALEWAVQLAERAGGELRIVNVAPRFHADFDRGERLEELRRDVAERVDAVAELRTGDPARELIALKGIDLMVVGSRAGSPLRRAMVGSVSAEVIHHAPFPVLVLPRGVHAPVESPA